MGTEWLISGQQINSTSAVQIAPARSNRIAFYIPQFVSATQFKLSFGQPASYFDSLVIPGKRYLFHRCNFGELITGEVYAERAFQPYSVAFVDVWDDNQCCTYKSCPEGGKYFNSVDPGLLPTTRFALALPANPTRESLIFTNLNNSTLGIWAKGPISPLGFPNIDGIFVSIFAHDILTYEYFGDLVRAEVWIFNTNLPGKGKITETYN